MGVLGGWAFFHERATPVGASSKPPPGLRSGLTDLVSKVRCVRGTSLTTKRTPLGSYRRHILRVLGGSWGGGRFLMSEVPLYGEDVRPEQLRGANRQ